jgi:hypothetical protein
MRLRLGEETRKIEMRPEIGRDSQQIGEINERYRVIFYFTIKGFLSFRFRHL